MVKILDYKDQQFPNKEDQLTLLIISIGSDYLQYFIH